MRATLAALLLLVACGGKDIGLGDPDAGGSGGDGGGSGDGGVPAGWTKLVSRTWSLGVNAEGYRCRRIQVQDDMWISAFRAMSPTGTHHEVVTIDPSGTSTGDYNCNAGTGAFNSQMVYAAGVMTDDLAFPTGVAVHIPAGTWINLNLHLFNLKDTPAADESGILVKTIPAAEVVNPADMTFAGTYSISIPSDNQPHTAIGGCTAPTDWHVFTLWPHMHQTATHQALTVTHAGAPSTLLDTAYQFGEQKNYPMAETIVHQGDQVQVTCTYVNNTGATITFGDSSTSEMCFTGMYKYPAGGGEFGCVH
ncbi:MAG: hypothetical protein JWO36_4850 [Myxococcales bacterium]|nr:hypothetical protein [Myxococcales bacterium]